MTDIKQELLTTAGDIVNGARRGAYGAPEDNFERIARFWQAYFENTGRSYISITAYDVSPMMRLMKEARLCESPRHKDSFVDIIGYALTGAEVNKVEVDAVDEVKPVARDKQTCFDCARSHWNTGEYSKVCASCYSYDKWVPRSSSVGE